MNKLFSSPCSMPELETESQKIEHILKNTKTIALVGATFREEMAANYVMKYLLDQGYQVFPINPKYAGQKLHNQTIYADMNDIKEEIDMVDIFRPGTEAEAIVKQSLDKNVKYIWLQLGIISKEAEDLALKNNKVFIQNRCTLVEHQKLN